MLSDSFVPLCTFLVLTVATATSVEWCIRPDREPSRSYHGSWRWKSLFGWLLLPAPAERPVKLHKALELVAAVLRQGQLGAAQRALVVEDLEGGGDAAAIARE